MAPAAAKVIKFESRTNFWFLYPSSVLTAAMTTRWQHKKKHFNAKQSLGSAAEVYSIQHHLLNTLHEWSKLEMWRLDLGWYVFHGQNIQFLFFYLSSVLTAVMTTRRQLKKKHFNAKQNLACAAEVYSIGYHLIYWIF